MIGKTPPKPLLIFDSGIGGLTVLREVRRLLPERPLLYLADDAGFPYGRWDEAPLRAHILDLFARVLAEHDPEAIIIACNTAFTLVGAELRQRFAHIPFIGTVPAIKPAAERTRTGMVSILATPGTIRRAYTHELIATFAGHHRVQLVGSDHLAPMAEAHVRGIPLCEEALRAEIAPCFVEHAGQRTDIVVLACTHYPFLTARFEALAPWPVLWLDPAEAIARQARRVVPPLVETHRSHASNNAPDGARDKAIFTAGPPDLATQRLLHSFGLHPA